MDDRQTAQRRLSARRQAGETLNIMVAGQRGVGKSTLLQTLCDSLPTLHVEKISDGGRTIYEACGHPDGVSSDGGQDPFYLFDALSGTRAMRSCYVRTVDPEFGEPVSVELIDTAGIGAQGESVGGLCAELERRLQATADEERRVRRWAARTRAQHVHAVLYVVAPPVCASATTDAPQHRLNAAADILGAADVDALRRLARLANVIVCVGKCDSVEMGDRALLKDRTLFAQAQRLVAPARLFAFDELVGGESRGEAHAFTRKLQRRVPFLVCGSKHVDEWQQMRVHTCPDDDDGELNQRSVADWRALLTRNNRPAPPPPRNRPASGVPGVAVVTRGGQRREIGLVREFPWGALHLQNRHHCDLDLLTDVLLTSFRRSLRRWTDDYFYESFRKQRAAVDPAFAATARDVRAFVEGAAQAAGSGAAAVLNGSASPVNTLFDPAAA
ncbi:Cell division control protein 11, partial [Coemansia sp. RSA 2618]